MKFLHFLSRTLTRAFLIVFTVWFSIVSILVMAVSGKHDINDIDV